MAMFTGVQNKTSKVLETSGSFQPRLPPTNPAHIYYLTFSHLLDPDLPAHSLARCAPTSSTISTPS